MYEGDVGGDPFSSGFCLQLYKENYTKLIEICEQIKFYLEHDLGFGIDLQPDMEDARQSGNTTNFGMAYLRQWRKHSIYVIRIQMDISY